MLIVIFLFLGTARATLIPAVTIPVSIIAAAIVMAVLDYSINTLTLLGAVLAIGLVVDDAIVVLENIVRRIEERRACRVLASINGSREIGFAVIATTLVLMAVFVPDVVHDGRHRAAVRRVRRDGGRRRRVLRVRRADAHADDGLETRSRTACRSRAWPAASIASSTTSTSVTPRACARDGRAASRCGSSVARSALFGAA